MKIVYLKIIILLFLLVQSINAQIITEAEYFFDTDPGFGKGIPLSPIDNNMDSTSVNVYGESSHNLKSGQHILYVRGKDSNGYWGPVNSIAFGVTETSIPVEGNYTIAASEYFFDIDPGKGNGFELPPFDGFFDSIIENVVLDNIDVSHLSEGNHCLFVRGMRNDGTWGTEKSIDFIIDRVSPTAVITNNSGSFINTNSISLNVTGDDISHYRYRLNTEKFSQEYSLTQPLLFSNLSDGEYNLSIIGRDSAGNWQSIENATLCSWTIDTKAPVILGLNDDTNPVKEKTWTWSASDSSTVKYRYLIDQKADWLNPSGIFSSVGTATLKNTTGKWYLHVQAKDAAGNISDMITVSAELSDEIINRPPSDLNIETATDKYIKLSWDYYYDHSQITYNVYKSEMPDGYYYQINTKPIRNGERFIDDYIDPQKSYYYKVKSILNGQESDFSHYIQATPQHQADFDIVLKETHKIVNATGSVVYPISIQYHEDFHDDIRITCMGLSDAFIPIFYLNEQDIGPILSDMAGKISLKIRTRSSTEPGEYLFTLRAVNTNNSNIVETDVFLTVISKQGKGISVSLENKLVHKKDSVRIYGQIFPPAPEKTVQLTLSKDNESKNRFTKTFSDGTFENTDWIQTLEIGEYQIQASWCDDTSNTHFSPWIDLIIRKGQGVLTCLKQSQLSAKRSEDFTVSGNLNLEENYPYITLNLISPVQDYQYYTAYQSSTGSYEITDNFFDQKGIYYFKAYWPGNSEYVGCESDLLPVAVETKRGMVIIVGGGFEELQNRLWLTTKYLCSKVYGHFKSNGFNDNDITLMLNTDSIDYQPDYKPDNVVDEQHPEKERFLEIIENQYSDVLDFETPLIIYMQGHGTEDGRFELLPNSEYVSYTEINNSLNVIQSQVHCPIILIIESCYSGKYLQTLKGENRIIMTSTDNKESITENNGILSFSYYLFSMLEEGKSVKTAFSEAKEERNKLGATPMLYDQANAANTYLISELWPASKPKIESIQLVRDMESNNTLTIKVAAQKGNYDISRLTAFIISPNLNMETAISIPEFTLGFDTQSTLYTGVLDGFICPGMYKIFVLATDTKNNDSLTEITMIQMPGSDLPGDLDGNCSITICDVVLGLKLLCGINDYSSIQLSNVLYIFQQLGNNE